MVLLDQDFNAFEIFEADRHAVIAVLTAPGSVARNERNAMSVSKFKSIGTLRWRRNVTAVAWSCLPRDFHTGLIKSYHVFSNLLLC
jgi:uncharacterized membrane-anchored protein